LHGEVSDKITKDFQIRLLNTLLSANEKIIHVVLREFTFEMQFLLDDYVDKKIDMSEMVNQYSELTNENCSIMVLKNVFYLGRTYPERVKLHAGVIPAKFVQKKKSTLSSLIA
jgi:hypothetical protein